MKEVGLSFPRHVEILSDISHMAYSRDHRGPFNFIRANNIIFDSADKTILAGPTAVSLAIVAMHFTRTLHPPGGATALIAIIGGDKIHSLGYTYVLSPVLLSSMVLLFVALLVNNMSANPKRHYPAYWF